MQYSQMDGVKRVIVGYSGGTEPFPTYMTIKDSSEAVLIEFDPSIITYQDILDHWSTHFAFFRSPPRTAQYRHSLFYRNSEQQSRAVAKVKELRKIAPAYVAIQNMDSFQFYQAEEYHQDFFLKSRAKIAAQAGE